MLLNQLKGGNGRSTCLINQDTTIIISPAAGGQYSTTNQCHKQCSRSLLSLLLLAPYRVGLPCHWCGGCLAAGPGGHCRGSLLAARCCLQPAERNRKSRSAADPKAREWRSRSRRKLEKPAEQPQAGTKTRSALHDIPNINAMHDTHGK